MSQGSESPAKPPGGPSPESRVGTVIQGEYHIAKLLPEDEDDLGPVYEASNPRLKGTFDVVMLRREQSPALKVMVAVRNDLRKARNLTAAGFHPMEQLADSSGVPGFAWERLPGETLRERLAHGPLKVGQALALCGVLARTVLEAHEDELIHGDLRPENILLVKTDAKNQSAGRAVLLRYALHHIRWYARQQRLLLRRNEPLPDSGAFRYAPPELRAGVVKSADARTDIYALGLIIHECLGGELTAGVGLGAPLEPNAAIGLTPELTATLNVVIAGACASDPQGRVQTMTELLRALRQVAKGADLPWPEEATGRKQVSIVKRLTGKLRVISPDVSESSRGLSGDDPSALGSAQTPPSEGPPGIGNRGAEAALSTEGRTEAASPAAPAELSPPPQRKAAPPSKPRGAIPMNAEVPPARAEPGAGAPSAPRLSVATSPPSSRSPPPPIPPEAEAPTGPPRPRGVSDRLTMPLKRVGDLETVRMSSPLTVASTTERAVDRSGRRDITRLVAAVQEGKMDPKAAMQEAQGVDLDTNLLRGPAWWPTRRDLVSAAIGSVVLILLLLALGVFRK